MYEYENLARRVYEDGATFIPVCVKCNRFVKADVEIKSNETGISPESNANCTKCGRTHMIFEGFI